MGVAVTTTATAMTTEAPVSPCVAGTNWQLTVSNTQFREVSVTCHAICKSATVLDLFTETWEMAASTRCCTTADGSCNTNNAWPCCDAHDQCDNLCDCQPKYQCMCRKAFRALLCVRNNATRDFVIKKYLP
ncbi:hypothetical protein LSAT2_007125 [Lamellibrachia satsuma]|nr:hypothetical protein LSAT2_007125 [Lamellibrachia satsuma]